MLQGMDVEGSSDCPLEKMKEKVEVMEKEIAIRTRQLAENKKKLKRICEAKKKLRETSIKRSGSGTTSPPCKQRLMYDNANEKVGEDNLSNNEITQQVNQHNMCEPELCTSQKSEETFIMDRIVTDDNMHASQQSTHEEGYETLIVCNEATSPENYLGKSIQCYVCDTLQRRTPKKKNTSQKVSSEDKWLCKKCSRTNSLTKCSLCEKSTGAKFIMEFTRERYNLSSNYVKKSIETLSDNTAKYQICSTCDRKLMKCSMLNCSLCERLCARRELREVKDQIMICKDLIRETQTKDGLLICVQCRGVLMDKVRCIVCDELKPRNNT